MTAMIDQATQLRSLLREQRRPRASVIAITSGKGGVGKSNIAVNLSIKLASARIAVRAASESAIRSTSISADTPDARHSLARSPASPSEISIAAEA